MSETTSSESTIESRMSLLEENAASTFAVMRRKISDLESDNAALKKECDTLYKLCDLSKEEICKILHEGWNSKIHFTEDWKKTRRLLKFRERTD